MALHGRKACWWQQPKEGEVMAEEESSACFHLSISSGTAARGMNHPHLGQITTSVNSP